ncbi:MAG: hypothetical protein EXR99_12930 [Gemmataceae bacterium]|nr:hypothetical protein [Gemmataceae bacterium]
MANQLIPPAGLELSIPSHLTPDQRVALWADLMDASEEILLAGLSHQVGPGGDLRAAYRLWYEQQMDEHDRTMRQMAESLYRRGVRHGR